MQPPSAHSICSYIGNTSRVLSTLDGLRFLLFDGNQCAWACAPRRSVAPAPKPLGPLVYLMIMVRVTPCERVSHIHLRTYMSCCHPFKAFETGYLTETGKRELVFSWIGSDVLAVDSIKQRIDLSKVSHHYEGGKLFLDDPIDVPCGSCVGCRMDKALDWKIRLCLELQTFPEAYFITLTYDDSHLPINEFGEPYLEKRHAQLFMKMLRKIVGDRLRFFLCGEYGETTQRPHFHLILFGHLEGFQLIGVNKFISPIIEKAWQRGQHVIECVSPGSIAYVAGYCEKKQKDPNWFNYPVKPFSLMSRKPGIGMYYFLDHFYDFQKVPKVTGVFSGDKPSSRALPKAFKKLLGDAAWYKERVAYYRAHKEDFAFLDRIIYKLVNPELIGDIKDEALRQRLEKVRINSL